MEIPFVFDDIEQYLYFICFTSRRASIIAHHHSSLSLFEFAPVPLAKMQFDPERKL